MCVICFCASVCVHCRKSQSSPKQRRLKLNFGAWKLPKVGKKKKNEGEIPEKGKLHCILGNEPGPCDSFFAARLSSVCRLQIGR